MKIRKNAEDLRRRLVSRSEVNVGTAVVNGVHCREWHGASHELGYGRLWDGERLRSTHRLSYEVFVGPIPEGLDVCHRCDNPRCIEPGHLWSGTHAENMADMTAKGRHQAAMIEVGKRRRGRPVPWLRGSRHAKAKLDEDVVRTIIRRLREPRPGGRDRASSIAREFGVSESLIRGIARGRNWTWLTGVCGK